MNISDCVMRTQLDRTAKTEKEGENAGELSTLSTFPLKTLKLTAKRIPDKAQARRLDYEDM
jgi:hypothetical protein